MPNPAAIRIAIIMPPKSAPMPRRSGDCAGSVSRITNAEMTRWFRNWYDWSWSRREVMPASPADRGEQPADVVEDAHHRARERNQRHDRDDVQQVGGPAQVGRGLPL